MGGRRFQVSDGGFRILGCVNDSREKKFDESAATSKYTIWYAVSEAPPRKQQVVALSNTWPTEYFQ